MTTSPIPLPTKGVAGEATPTGHNRNGTRKPDFAAINRTALANLPALLARWVPDGQRRGHEWVARNPTRPDRHRGSFCVNLRTGKWADFATGDRGGDPISLAAYLHGLTQGDAARRLASMLGVR